MSFAFDYWVRVNICHNKFLINLVHLYLHVFSPCDNNYLGVMYSVKFNCCPQYLCTCFVHCLPHVQPRALEFPLISRKPCPSAWLLSLQCQLIPWSSVVSSLCHRFQSGRSTEWTQIFGRGLVCKVKKAYNFPVYPCTTILTNNLGMIL